VSRSYFVAIPLFILIAAVQATLLSKLTLFEQSLQLTALLPICWAVLRGPEEGIVWGFIAGIALDFYSIGPTGAHAIAIMLAVGAITLAQLGLPFNHYWLPPLLGGIGGALYLATYAVLLQVSGYTTDWAIFNDIILFTLAQAVLTIPAYWSLYTLRRYLYPPEVVRMS